MCSNADPTMSDVLPAPQTDAEFQAIDPTTDYSAALRLIAERAGIETSAKPVRFEDGSLPVFALAGHVVKLYPPSSEHSYRNERRVLQHLDGALSIATPRVHAAGPLEGWHYVVMTRLLGRPLRVRFEDVPPADRSRLFSRLGAAIAGMHALPTGSLPRHDWAAFVQQQRAGCVARHRRLGLDESWLAQIEPFLDRVVPELVIDRGHALLHTEIMREHVFVDDTAGWFELSGLLDFEPSRVGPPEYELASVGVFLTEGDAGLWSAFVDGLGLSGGGRDPALARRCMAWALLHRYAHLRRWLERLPARSARRSLDDLASEWFCDPSGT